MKCSIVACFKNEALYLQEWIEFHRLVGFDEFVLYNNNSSDHFEEVLAPYTEAGIVRLEHCPLDWCQLPVYYHAIHTNVTRADWLAFIDIDEFLFRPDGGELKALLKEFPDASALVAPWRVFGSSGHSSRPEGLVIENYTRRALDEFPENRHLKSIVRPSRCFAPLDPHRFVPRKGLPVDELGRVIREAKAPDDRLGGRLRINHYFTKSREEWDLKRNRGRADLTGGVKRPDADFERNDRNEVEDTAIHRYLEPLRLALGA